MADESTNVTVKMKNRKDLTDAALVVAMRTRSLLNNRYNRWEKEKKKIRQIRTHAVIENTSIIQQQPQKYVKNQTKIYKIIENDVKILHK